MDRLTGLYEENGISITASPSPLTGTLVPLHFPRRELRHRGPGGSRQGVKNITVGYGQLGNLLQDVAFIRPWTA